MLLRSVIRKQSMLVLAALLVSAAPAIISDARAATPTIANGASHTDRKALQDKITAATDAAFAARNEKLRAANAGRPFVRGLAIQRDQQLKRNDGILDFWVSRFQKPKYAELRTKIITEGIDQALTHVDEKIPSNPPTSEAALNTDQLLQMKGELLEIKMDYAAALAANKLLLKNHPDNFLTKDNIARILHRMSFSEPPPEKIELFTEAEQVLTEAFNAAPPGELTSEKYAIARKLYSKITFEHAEFESTEKSHNLLVQSADSLKLYLAAAPKTITPEKLTDDEFNLAVILSGVADSAAPGEQVAARRESVKAFQSVVSKRNAATQPSQFAESKFRFAHSARLLATSVPPAEALPLYNDAAKSYREAADAYIQAKIPQRASMALMNAGNIYSNIAELSDAAARPKLFQDAIAVFQESIKLVPPGSNDVILSSALSNITLPYIYSGKYEEALKACDESMTKGVPTDAQFANRAHALLFAGRFDEAKAIYEKYAKNPNFAAGCQSDFAAFETFGLPKEQIAKARTLVPPLAVEK